MREKAFKERSKVIPPGPQQFYIGADQGVKRPRPAPNQAALDRLAEDAFDREQTYPRFAHWLESLAG